MVTVVFRSPEGVRTTISRVPTATGWLVTGVPPTFAGPAGMIQETYGYFNGAFLEGAQGGRHDDAFIALWRSQPRRTLGFRFGDVDKDAQAHLVVTRPRPKL